MPTEAALRPVASATVPLRMMANGNPLPALSAVSPSAANRPVPMIMAAVRNVAVVGPKVRANDGLDSAFGCTLASWLIYSPLIVVALHAFQRHFKSRSLYSLTEAELDGPRSHVHVPG